MTTQEMGTVYGTLLSVPGMQENVKIDLRISRKTVLLLTQVLERGMNVKGKQELPDVVSPEEMHALKDISESCLEKAGLTELSEKLKKLSVQ